MTSRCQGSKISGSQQSLLTGTAICIVERWKKSKGFFFFCHICRTTVCQDPERNGLKRSQLLSALGSELGRCLFLPGSFLSLTIIPRMRVGYEMFDSQRGATRRVSLL